MGTNTFAALLLAEQYHQRWEIEKTIDELKTHLLGRKTPIRSLKPREVVQEIYGWLIGHIAIRSLMLQAANVAEISPLRLSFTETLRVIKRALPDFQDVNNEQLPFFFPGLSTTSKRKKFRSLSIETILGLSRNLVPSSPLKSLFIVLHRRKLNL